MLGIRSAAVKAPASGEMLRKWAKARWRTSPISRERRMPRRHQRGAPARAPAVANGSRSRAEASRLYSQLAYLPRRMHLPPRWGLCVAVALLCTGASAADPEPSPGPLPWQEPGPSSRLFLQQPFRAPEPEPSGLGVRLVSANIFFASPPAMGTTQVQFDEETLTLVLTGTLAVGERLGFQLTLPIVLQYGGWLDPIINAVEGVFNPDSARRQAPLYRTIARIETPSGGLLEQSGPALALGDVSLGAQQLLLTADGARPALALRQAIKLPTGGRFAGSGTFDVGAGLLLAWELGWLGIDVALDAALPAGRLDPPGLDTRPYGSAQLGFGFRVARPVTLHLQLSCHTSPLHVPDAPSLSSNTCYLLTGVGWDPSPTVALHFALAENILSPDRGADYTVMLGARFAFGGR